MEEKNTDRSSMSSEEGSNASFKDTLKSGSPDEVKDRVKDVVEKGVAAVAGALKGFNRGTEKNQLPEEAKGAIHQAAETTKSTVSSVSEGVSGLREPLREAGQKLGETTRDLSSTVREQVDETRSAVRGAGSSGSSASLGSAGSAGSLGRSGPRDMGMGGSELGSSRASSGQGTELPDIRNTPLAESDRKLVGKDLTSDLDLEEE